MLALEYEASQIWAKKLRLDQRRGSRSAVPAFGSSAQLVMREGAALRLGLRAQRPTPK
jgi:hypothetical protein